MKYKVEEFIIANIDMPKQLTKPSTHEFDSFNKANNFIKNRLKEIIEDILDCEEIETFNISCEDCFTYIIINEYIIDKKTVKEKIYLNIIEN